VVVPGDVLILGTGTRVAADAKLAVAYSLQVDESALTGESFPHEKQAGDEICCGTVVMACECKATVTATGRSTRIGQLSAAGREIKQPKTPLQKSMKSLAMGLVWIAVFFSVLIPVIGLLHGQPFKEMVLGTGALEKSANSYSFFIISCLSLFLYRLASRTFS
jgi:P-type Ca2+ transporter type 2C